MNLFGDLGRIGAGVLLGAAAPSRAPDPMGLAVNAKVEELRRRGHRVAPAEGPIPGLWVVDNMPELTTGQLLSL